MKTNAVFEKQSTDTRADLCYTEHFARSVRKKSASGREEMDRRIARTREILQDALNSLTLKMGYEAVTITDICDATNVGRSTFYAHFTSKDDLKRSGLDDLRQHLSVRQKAPLADGGFGRRRHASGPDPQFQSDHAGTCPRPRGALQGADG